MEWRQSRALPRTSAAVFVQSLCPAELARTFWARARLSWVSEWLPVRWTTLLSGKVGLLEEAQPMAGTLFRSPCSSHKNLLSFLDFWMEASLDGWEFVFLSPNSSVHKHDV